MSSSSSTNPNYRAHSLNPKRLSQPSTSPTSLTKNYILSKMNTKIKEIAMRQNEELSAADLIAKTSLDNAPKQPLSARRNSNALLMKKRDDTGPSDQKRRMRNIEALSRIGEAPTVSGNPPLAKKRSSFSAMQEMATESSSNAPSLPSHSSSDPLTTSLISRLKLLEEKCKTLESTLKHKDSELKRLRKLGRHHKRENEAYQSRMGDMIEFVEDVAEYLMDNSPNHPFHSHIASVAQFALELEKRDGRLVDDKKEELQLNFERIGRDRARELEVHERRVAGGRVISHGKPTSSSAGTANVSSQPASQRSSPPKTSSSSSPQSSHTTTTQPDEYDERNVSDMPPAPRKINIPLLEQRISQLNAALAEEFEIVKNENGHSQFKQRKEVVIVFYLNGIIIDGGSFRPYEWDLTKAFIIDILDGYFPFEFKENYPNGVPMRIVDRSEEIYTKSTDVLQKDLGNIHNLDQIKEEITRSGAPKNKKEFLERLPKQIVRDGKLINVRQNIASIMGDSLKESDLDVGQKEVTCNTEAYAVVTKHKEENTKPPKHALLRLKVPKLAHTKLETIFIYMFPEQTVEQLRAEIDKHINSQGNVQYSIRCWPNVRLDDVTKTMQEARLVPNATLFIHQI